MREHSTHWGNYYQSYLHYQPRYLVAYTNEKPLALLLFFIRPYGPERLYAYQGISFVKSILKTILPVISWMQGPVILGNVGEDIIGRIISYLYHEYCPQHSILGLDQCHLLYGVPLPLISRDILHYRRGSLLVDLELTEQQAWNKLKGSARRKVHRGQKMGVSVYRGIAPKDFQAYFDFLKMSKKWYSASAELMSKHVIPNENLEVFLATHEEKIVSALGIWKFGGSLITAGGYNTSPNLCGGDAITWSVIQYGIEHKFKHYDLAGISLEPQSVKRANIRSFKEKWGGHLVTNEVFSLYPRSLRGKFLRQVNIYINELPALASFREEKLRIHHP